MFHVMTVIIVRYANYVSYAIFAKLHASRARAVLDVKNAIHVKGALHANMSEVIGVWL